MTNHRKPRRTNSNSGAQARAIANAGSRKDLRSTPMNTTPKANGHAPVSTTREEISMFENWAASDDAGGPPVAETASSAAACANRDAYAEMAPANAEGKRLPIPGAASRPPRANREDSGTTPSNKKKTAPDIPPGAEPLPPDGASFVEAIHEKVDLIELEVSLLKSDDEKIRQRELAYLRELIYGKNAAFSTDDEIPHVVFGPPDAPRDPGRA